MLENEFEIKDLGVYKFMLIDCMRIIKKEVSINLVFFHEIDQIKKLVNGF
jgi:hypothetical protein